jgi:outer membrane protein assembly factor BamA
LYLRGEASATVYWLESPGYSRTGGLYRVAYEEFNPLRGSGGTFGFLRTEVVQHVPILRETWALSLRAGTESIVRKSDVMPYFLMPTLGSGDTLRGYANQRFRDRHSLLLSSELRWFPNRLGLDMALFVDAGKVAPFRNGLTLHDMKTDYGIGVRFHTPIATPLRVDLARGHEGMRLVVAAGATF